MARLTDDNLRARWWSQRELRCNALCQDAKKVAAELKKQEAASLKDLSAKPAALQLCFE